MSNHKRKVSSLTATHDWNNADPIAPCPHTCLSHMVPGQKHPMGTLGILPASSPVLLDSCGTHRWWTVELTAPRCPSFALLIRQTSCIRCPRYTAWQSQRTPLQMLSSIYPYSPIHATRLQLDVQELSREDQYFNHLQILQPLWLFLYSTSNAFKTWYGLSRTYVPFIIKLHRYVTEEAEKKKHVPSKWWEYYNYTQDLMREVIRNRI